MREHALPQDVTGYKFHIIGNMTLKQFVEVGAGFVIAFILYQTNLPGLIKYPVMVLSAGIGAMLAFVPIEERPLDQWFTALFRALYRPTQYYWKRTSKIPEPFLYEARTNVQSVVGQIDLSPARRQRVKEYLRSIDTAPTVDQFDTYENQRVDEVMMVFQSDMTQQHPSNFSQPDQDQANEDAVNQLSFVGRASGVDTPLDLDPDVQADLATDVIDPQAQAVLDMFDTATTSEEFNQQVAQVPEQPAPLEQPAPTADALPEVPQIQLQNVFDAAAVDATPVALPPEAPARLADQPDLTIGHIIEEEGGSTQPATDQAATPVPTQPREILIPETELIQVEQAARAAAAAAQNNDLSGLPSIELTDTTQVGLSEDYKAPQIITDLQQVTFNTSLPFPNKPDMPNKVVGMVIDTQGAPVPNAIVEILTQTGLPARAVKTNPLGQFFITTPLSVGEYVIRVEKEGLQFVDHQLSVQNQVIDPLELRAA